MKVVTEPSSQPIGRLRPFHAPGGTARVADACRPLDFPYSIPYSVAVKATVTSKGKVTIPLAIRRKLKLHRGTVLEFDEGADHLKASKSVDVGRMHAVIGIARDKLAGKSVEGWMEELRGPVPLPRRRRRR